MILIGVIGFKKSGKDTFADYLVSQYGFKKYAFADPVKDICQVMFQLEQQQLHDPDKKEMIDPRWMMSPRQMMQKIGTDMVRTMLGDDFWVHHMDLKVCKEKAQRIVISDVRFINEAKWIKDNHGVLIRIVSHEKCSDTHLSEVEQLSIQEDICLQNNKSGINKFHQSIDLILPHIFSS